jgi:uncharacterized membrane protein HdeD (DUF308 family)
LLALRGILAIAFGVAALAWPGLTLVVLVTLFGAYAIVDGVIAILAVMRHQERGRWWVVLVEGILGVAAGLVALAVPGITAVALVLIIGAWAILTGVMEIAAAVRLRREPSAFAGRWNRSGCSDWPGSFPWCSGRPLWSSPVPEQLRWSP